ncbi:MAG: cytochrome c biogenesis protein CcdA [Tidjanibacter sp.]|nr:cytochrome c biogenesis protein CcdA [Tidjanibacter sp.]
MKKYTTLFITLLITIVSLSAQTVVWKTTAQQSEGNLYNITLTAEIERGWHMYDMGPYELGGPNATVITFAEGEGYELVGAVEQLSAPHRYFDNTYGMEIGTFADRASFGQRVRLTEKGATIRGNVEWMLCDDSSCIPPTDRDFEVQAGEPLTVAATAVPTASEPAADNSSLWAMIIEAILWGFAALLTPCVFPMIPMTVSFFMKGSGDKSQGRFKAAMYGLFIVLLYTVPIAVIILLTKFIGGDAVTADIFNWLATHWLPNIIFFVVFMVFAASFFGAFEIVMPSKLVNKSDEKVDKKKGLGGVFFLALTLVLVSFSCTGPIVGTVLIKSTAGEFWTPIVTMLAFSLAFALPFVLFALFPGVLNRLPKSGGWLNSIKVVLGFVEVALGFKFLSTADQVYHWGLLDREIYLAIWIVCFTMLGFYLLGKLRFKHDSEVQSIGVTRLALSIVCFTFVVYMIPGMWGAPLKGLSGYLPPMETQDFVLGEPSATVVTTPTRSADNKAKKYADFLELPQGLEGYFYLPEALEESKRVGKPVFLDFTGHGCVNCREMESRVWSDPRVRQMLQNDFVVCALYTDDKKQVPTEDWVTTDSGKVLKTLGKINSHYALQQYNTNAQPTYVILNSAGKVLAGPRGYNLDVDAFLSWLKSGIEAYEASNDMGR